MLIHRPSLTTLMSIRYKTKVISFASPTASVYISSVLNHNIQKLVGKNLGVCFDTLKVHLKGHKEIHSVVSASLRRNAKRWIFHSSVDCEKVVNAFILSRLDYCNELSQVALHQLQVLQNVACFPAVVFLLFCGFILFFYQNV